MIPREKIDRIIKLRKDGKKLKEIVKDTGISIGAVNKICVAAGVTKQTRTIKGKQIAEEAVWTRMEKRSQKKLRKLYNPKNIITGYLIEDMIVNPVYKKYQSVPRWVKI